MNAPISPESHPKWAIEVSDLSKRFQSRGGRAVQALNGVSFTVPRTGVFCILGPNGAGKTTLLRILTTMTRPDQGWARIEGLDLTQQTLAVRQRIGMVSQDNHFDRYLSIWHNLTLHAELHGLDQPTYTRIISELLERVGLYARRFDAPDTLSGGMQRRVSLIRALIHRPSLLFLDEPTTGLDPQARRELWDTITDLKSQATVVLTTHYLDEADQLSDQILMMNHGQVVMTGTPRQLKQALTPVDQFELVFQEPVAAECRDRWQADGLLSNAPPFEDPYRLRLDAATWERVAPHVPWSEVDRVGRLEADLEAVFMAVAHGPGGQP